ncbi:MAG: hypothetical protein EZS28_011603 [Streblomastix strix]|uniref:Uncharacterized protein n=1 Tax=Streblomastix strix TaxID=222440 RepID=A0A5J4WEA1_9EUKA|nr:MAG: hypothetical protein EZS28_011603 [Streblomastix strix]
MQYKDSQRQLNTSRQVQQFDIELPSANKNLEIINAIESGLEEANRNVLRQFIGDLPFNSILKENSDHNIALDNVIALLFEVLMSPREDESDSAMNLFKEGIKKRRDFRIAACNRGGILGRGANIIAHSHQQNNLDHQSQSPLNQTIAEFFRNQRRLKLDFGIQLKLMN